MLKKAIFLIVLLPSIAFAGKLDRIKKAIDGGDYTKAQELIYKAIEKEPSNPGISYFQAILYQITSFQNFNLDSARKAIDKSIADFVKTDERSISDLIEDGITLEVIKDLQVSIRDRQFQQLLSELSIERVSAFRDKYPNSIYDDVLEFKRDSIVFLNIKKQPNQKNIGEFISEYPTSIFVPEAKKILDQLRYDELKSNGKLEEYYRFLTKFPTTNFREQVEEFILKNSTLDHSPESYSDFIKWSEINRLKKKAADLFYYCSGRTREFISNHPYSDSIQQIHQVSELSLFPIVAQNKFGFANSHGELQIDFQYDQVETENKCVTKTDDWIFVKRAGVGFIVDKLGHKILSGIEGYTDLTNGVALVDQDELKYLYHKSGFKIIEEPIDGAEVLGDRWIKIKMNSKSKLISFQGIPITETEYDDIYLEGDFWIFKKRELLAVYTEELIAAELHKSGLSLEFKFDDIELVNNEMFIGFRDGKECLIDKKLFFLIPWGKYAIHPDESGWYLKSSQGYQLFNSQDSNILDRQFPYLESNNGWLALKTDNDWMLLPRNENIPPSRGYDSLKLINDFVALTIINGQNEIVFNDGSLLKLRQDEQLKTFANTNHISISNGSDITLYNENGESLMSGKYNKVSFLNDTLIKVELKNKQGVLNTRGTFVFQPVFDLIDRQGDMLFLLEGSKIGCFDMARNVVFLPKYESRLEKIGDHYSAKLNGKYGLFDLEEQPILEFDYDEISFWNDTTFRVKTDTYFELINSSEEIMVSGIELMSKITDMGSEEIWKFVRDGKYGLISTQNGILLDSEFTDIFNIGSNQNPLFFADQHLDKAGFHVVSYVNNKGELLISRAYTIDEFDMILCDD